MIIQTEKGWKVILNNDGVEIYHGKYKTLKKAVNEAGEWLKELWIMGMEPEGWQIVRKV